MLDQFATGESAQPHSTANTCAMLALGTHTHTGESKLACMKVQTNTRMVEEERFQHTLSQKQTLLWWPIALALVGSVLSCCT